MLKAVFALILFAGIMAIVDLETSTPPFCISDDAAQADGIQYNENCAPLSRAVISYGRDGFTFIGHFIHDFKDEIVAAFTVILAISTLYLWLATRKLVKGAEDTAQRQLRAYVFLDSIDLPRLNVPGTHTMQRKIKIAWKNFGGTRTRRFIAKVSHDVLDLSKQPLETFDFHDEPNAQTFHGLIGPSQSVNPPPIPVCDIHLVGDNDTALVIWGWAEYQDVFSPTIHRTEFGFRVWIEGDISGNCLIWFESTEKHNAADNDCMKPPTSAA